MTGPKREAFAKLLDKLMREGVNAVDAQGAKAGVWSNVALAARIEHLRIKTGDGETSPNMIANWRKGKFLCANVEPLIDAIYGKPAKDGKAAGRLRRAYREAAAERAAGDLARLRKTTGERFHADGPRAALATGPRPSDLTRAQDPNRRQLQSHVRAAAEKLAARLGGDAPAEPDAIFAAVAAATGSLAEIAALEPKALVKRLGDLYAYVNNLAGYAVTDRETRARPGSNRPTLDPDAFGELGALVGVAFPWARGFPTIAEWDEDAAKAERPSAPAAARAYVGAARERDAVRAVDAKTIETLATGANDETAAGRKAGRLATEFASGLFAFLSEFLAKREAGALDPTAEDDESLAEKALAILLQEPKAAETLAGSQLGRFVADVVASAQRDPETPKPPPNLLPILFLSYSHLDERERPPGDWRGWKEWALSFLRPLERSGAAKLFVDSDMRGEDAWEREIAEKLAACDLFVLLVSRHSLSSDYILGTELPAIRRRRERGEAVRLYPVVLTKPLNETLDLVRNDTLLRPTDGRPLALLPPPERDHAMAEIADELATLAREIAAAKKAPPKDVEDRAREMILRGVAPPAHWRRHILRLDFAGTDLADAAPLAGLSALTSLSLWGTKMTDAAPLAGLTALTWLNLSYTQIADAAPLAGLTALTSLDLVYTKIADAAPLAGLTALTSLDLAYTKIADAAPLAGLTALTTLSLGGTQIADAAPLAGLTALTSLDLSDTQVADAAPLAGLTALTWLNLSDTEIADAAPLAGLSALTSLDLSNTQVADAAPLAGLTALTSLDLSITKITDFAPLAGLTALTILYLMNAPITDAAPLAGLTALSSLDLSYTQIADAAPLAGLTTLTSLDLSNTKIADVAALINLTAMETLNLSETKIIKLTSSYIHSGHLLGTSFNFAGDEMTVSPFVNLSNIQSLKLAGAAISDIEPLSKLSKLRLLDLASTNIVDLSPLSSLAALVELDLSNTRVRDLSPLASLHALRKLLLTDAPKLDLAPLADLIANGLEIIGKRVSKTSAPRRGRKRPPASGAFRG